MTRPVVVILVGLAGMAVVGHRWHAPFVVAPGTEPVETRGDDGDLQRKIDARRGFAAYCEQVMRELTRGDISLRETCRRISSYCLTRYPEYLEHIATLDEGSNLHHKLARRLVTNATGPDSTLSQERVRALGQELNEILHDDADLSVACATH